MKVSFRSHLLVLGLLAAAGCNHRVPIGDTGSMPTVDGGEVDLAAPRPEADLGTGVCSDKEPCAAGQRCHQGMCIADRGACRIDDECQGDSWCECEASPTDGGACEQGACIPWGTGARGLFDPQCAQPGFSAVDFKPPKLKCQWTEAKGQEVGSTPMVADLDGDKIPEIIFGPNAMGNSTERIVALRSKDCSVYFDKDAPLAPCSQYAIGDLDGDKVPEIVGVTGKGLVKVFDNQGNLLATSPEAYKYIGPRGSECSGPALGNIDGVGPAEIAIAGQVLRYNKGDPVLEVLFNNAPPMATWGFQSVIADLDGDGRAEVIAGTEIYDGITGANKTPTALTDLKWTIGSYPAVADFNRDGKPDVVLVRSAAGLQQLVVIDYAHNKILFGPYGVQNGGWGGTPTVADVDGDGVPDIGFASARNYYVYALKCAAQPRPKDCTGIEPGVLWQKDTHDATSGGTGSSVFDFNGDGKAEVVYRDECWLRVYNGPDGKTLFAANVTSGTGLEYPVIADVDNDGHADIVVSADRFVGCPAMPEAETMTPWVGITQGILIFRDPFNRWMPSRPLWNQHTYHITNINDDLTIPAKEPANWRTWNSYRQNVQVGPDQGGGPQADLTGGAAVGIDVGDKDCAASWTLRANLCNRGPKSLAAGVPGTFYTSDPRMFSGGQVCTTVSRATLEPGQCELLECEWKMPGRGPVDLWFRGDDDGTGKSSIRECKEMNNLLSLPHSECMQVQ